MSQPAHPAAPRPGRRHPALAATATALAAAVLLLAGGCASTATTAPTASEGTAAATMQQPAAPAMEAAASSSEAMGSEAMSSEAMDSGATASSAAAESSDALAALLSSMDRTADPCQDFYQYACGGWLAHTERPADEPRWVRSFSVIQQRNRETIRDILEQAAENPKPGSSEERIGRYYAACMDEAAVEEAGTRPLARAFAEIDQVRDPESLMRVTGELFRYGANPLFGIAAYADFKDPDTDIGFFYQGGIGMPDRDYYVSDDPAKQKLLAEYQKHVAKMLELIGRDADTAAKQAADIVAFETALAKVSRPAADLRDPDTLYHKIDLAGLQELTPKLPWQPFFDAVGHPGIRAINVATPKFFEGLEPAVLATPMETLRNYLEWTLVNATANRLPQAFVDAHFDFFGRELAGQSEIRPRWKRCVAATQNALGEEVGKVYVARRFAGDSKQKALEMIGDIQAAFAADLPTLAWMDDVTRQRALDKAKAVIDKIGYPDEWRDYSGLSVKPDDYFANGAAADAFELDFQLDKIGHPVDKKEWNMNPQAVNAYYNPLVNEIVFPAGILQPPFFERDFPAPMNYGAIGAVIGHELTHGFDDQGRKFDAEGRLREWWEPEVAKRFEKRAQCIEDLYSTYEVEPGVHVQGKLTLGENIADIGGLKQAYSAYQLWQQRHGAPKLATDLTPEQVLFVSFGQVWCSKASKEVERLQVTTNPHSPARFRVIGPVSNNPAFAKAFHCPAGSPMAPKNRCEVW